MTHFQPHPRDPEQRIFISENVAVHRDDFQPFSARARALNIKRLTSCV